MRYAVKSDKGIVRNINEDSYNILSGYSNIPVSFIIADGMGGHNSGEIASQMAVNYISSFIMENPEGFVDENSVNASIQDVILKANDEIYNESLNKDEYSGMGTTLILAVICNKKIFIGHVGDSRVYVIRGDNMEQVTTDHSYIEELMRNGSITREEAQKHPKRNLITRALGCNETVEIDLYSCNLKENDIYILCTDGLTNMIDEMSIKEIAQKYDDPEAVCNELVNMANAKGGEDNITVIVINN